MNVVPTPDGGRLPDNIVYFARVLRAAGIPVGPAKVIEAIRAVELAGLGGRDDFYWTLHALFVARREHHEVFDEAFRVFWRSRDLKEKILEILSPVAPARPRAPERPNAAATRVAQALSGKSDEPPPEAPELELDARLTMSSREVLQSKDFAQMTVDEIAEAKRLMAALILPHDKIRTRRLVAAPRGRIDPRRTLRASLRAGGDIIVPRFRERAQIRPPIVALCDISGSMSHYSRMMLHFLHALTERRRRVTSFVFGTRLTNITRQIRSKDPDFALAACSEVVADWSGGTRIASALAAFNRQWSRRVLSQGPIVLLITDGLERDSTEDLAHEVDRLHRSCRRLIWLNPLLRFDGFEAKARGIRTMLPHVDEFRSVHSLDTLADLCGALSAQSGGLHDPRSWLDAA